MQKSTVICKHFSTDHLQASECKPKEHHSDNQGDNKSEKKIVEGDSDMLHLE